MRLFAFIPLFIVISCSFPRTQTIVDLRADARVISEASEIHIEVRDAANQVVFTRDVNPMSASFVGFPIEIPISAKNGEESRTFELRALATTQRRNPDGSLLTTPIAQNRVRTSFRRGHVLRFTLWLLSGCRCNVETERCEPDADGDLVPECEPIAIDVNQTVAGGIDASVDGTVSETAPTCSAAQRLCGTQCVSRHSPIACGPSCTRCDSVTGGDPVCESDLCGVSCGASTPDHCTDACVNFDNDRTHCGNCSTVCAQGQLCVNRLCVAPPQCSMTQDPACTGQTYCNLTTRMCAPGCDGRNGQCPLGQMCDAQGNACVCASGTQMCGTACVTCPTGANIASVGCEGNACIVRSCDTGFSRNSTNTACSCTAPNRMCGSSCVACPSDANATATACSANSCVISGCSAGFSVNAAGTTCVMTGPLPIFSGAPLAIVRPADADRFGCSVSLSGDGNTLAVGDYNGGSSTNGSATVYTRSSGAWSSGTGVSRPTGAENFGYDLSLSLDGNTLVVGNVGGSNSYGAAIVYTRNSGTWGTGTTVARPSGATDYFGAKVSLSGDGTALVVGGNGSATVYTRSNGTWSTGTNISPPNGTRDFGSSVSLSQNGNTLVVGDYSGGAGLNGSATAYARNNGTWSAGTNITRPIDVIGNFGIDVSLSGDSNTLVVGSEVLATVYTRSGANWNTGTNVTRPSAASVAFGTSVALSTDGNTLVVGDYTGSSDMHGSATVYTRAGGSWSAGTNVTRPDDGAVRFGTSVALSGDGSTLVVVDYDSVVYVYTR